MRGSGYHNSIFVFGSNREGIHGAGAASFALRWMGAELGEGEGLAGKSYALPTKSTPNLSLTLPEIQEHVDRFLEFARRKPTLRFMVTKVGCGLAGFSEEEIAPLFRDAPANCLLPGTWLQKLRPEGIPARVIIAGSRGILDREFVFHHLNRMLSRLQESRLEIVSGLAQGPDLLGKAWAEAQGIPVVEYPAEWDWFKKAAGFFRNNEMAWYGTHLLAFWDGASPGTRHMLQAAQGLTTRIIQGGNL